MKSDAADTIPEEGECDHIDMCGDSLIEVQGDERWCTSCGVRWRDTHTVIVNDETV